MSTATYPASRPAHVPALAAGDITGIVVGMLPVTDLAVSAAWYRDLLGIPYLREFAGPDGVVTGCAVADLDTGYMISFRLRGTTAGRPDLRGEHPIILQVRDRAALDRVRARAQALGYRPTGGEHADAAWVEVVDPDGIATRFAVLTSPRATFMGVVFHEDGSATHYDMPRLELPAAR
jgi:catechol 2,3-dioxygenase-like lactoylglutathione lyase family enzyme